MECHGIVILCIACANHVKFVRANIQLINISHTHKRSAKKTKKKQPIGHGMTAFCTSLWMCVSLTAIVNESFKNFKKERRRKKPKPTNHVKCQWSVEIFRCVDLIYSFRSEISCSDNLFASYQLFLWMFHWSIHRFSWYV